MKVALIAGARPNFMKVAPISRELKKQNIDHILINTGQHFSANMSKDFFDEFDVHPDYNFEPDRSSVIKQIADIMTSLEEVFNKEKPTVVLVVGDVNSTLVASLVANKMGIKLVHVEAGLRSFNKLMPEEHNRIATDHMSDMLLVTSEDGITNLAKEGITENVFSVGNIMIDTLVYNLPKVKVVDDRFYFCTLHRAENIDYKHIFVEILDALEEIAEDRKVYLPLHPRTAKRAKEFGLEERIQSIFEVLGPLKYIDSLYYQKNAELVLTDSGGIQEETSYLGTPCLTIRTETERPVTVDLGTNIIAGTSKAGILNAYKNIDKTKKDTDIPLWDGRAAERIVKKLLEVFG